jgi:hypothetical protein
MTDTPSTTSQQSLAIPADDPNRKLTIADPDGVGMRHISVVGDTYTVLVSGAQTARALLPHRYADTRRQRPSAASPRF